ncbi:LRR receptor-like serine/threonine-protein kinase [Pyrus ussuriensis x Pyrus communis]|uniref:LRR receptor-like serine/threonine-protein kinase n=1 Tax=Pyrus ussuriensis x Pyrus communis TaxID=2448454 RepID=A0A5N5FB48_9ROSA|nr:LRR receptor-like serine/threonine-protein kinase [Pyrus ussuriensis x Pyrus communis]
MDKCKALRSIRHIDLLRIITACSSIDNQGQDLKSLVFEYMVNGSLDAWLHLKDDEQSRRKRLSLIQKRNIAIEVAFALDYIHHRCGTSIVHCDMKPGNVLLNKDMVAHVGDFGLARFILEEFDDPSQNQTMSTGLKGSKATFLQFATMVIPDHAMDIVDPSLLIEYEDAHGDQIPVHARRLKECSVLIMQIGLSCSLISLSERMLMDVVVNKLKKIGESYLNLRGRG